MRALIIMTLLVPIFCVFLMILSYKHVDTQPTPLPPQPPPQPQEQKPGDKVIWTDFKPIKNLSDPNWGIYLTDIENHLHPSLGNQYRDSDKVTWSHETTHGIHSWLNNNLQKQRDSYYFYVGYNKAAGIKQPKFKIADVAKIIPKSLQKSRYNLYLIRQQQGWNNEPLYLWDEWIAYCNGIECGIELTKKGNYKPNKNDSCFAVLEFSVYATYVAMTQKSKDPNYDNKQLLEFLAWNLDRSMKLYQEGKKLNAYNWDDDQYLKHVQTHEDAKEFRQFLVNTYGKKWTKEVFNFE